MILLQNSVVGQFKSLTLRQAQGEAKTKTLMLSLSKHEGLRISEDGD